MLFHLLTMNRHLIPLRNSYSKTDWSTPGEKTQENLFSPFGFFYCFLIYSLFFHYMTWTISFMYPPLSSYSDYWEFLLVRWENGTLEKSVGKKKSQHLPVFKQNYLQETDLKGSCWHMSYVVEKTDIISNAFEYLMQRKGLKVSLSSTRVFH